MSKIIAWKKIETKYRSGEEAFYFQSANERRLFGFLHYPATVARNIGVVFCQPFTDEKNTSHIVITNTARQLALIGFHVLRFDLSGCGDSQGEMDEFTVFDWLRDVEAAVSAMKSKTSVKRIVLWGLRFGGGLALLHSAKNPDISSLILWQPVLDFKEHINQFLFKKFASQDGFKALQGNSVSKLINELTDSGGIHVIGYPITKDMYDSFIQISEEPFSIRPEYNMLLISISPFEEPVLKIKRYIESFGNEKSDFHYTHFLAEPFWDRYWRRECKEATSATIKWADNTL